MTIRSRWPGLCILLPLSLCLAGNTIGETPPGVRSQIAVETPPEPAVAMSTEEIRRAIRELDANQFVQRREAALRLTRVGEPAITSLTQAAVHGSREVSTSALAILRKHYAKRQPASLHTAAKRALQEIAQSDHPRAARQAKSILDPPALLPPAPPAIQFQGGQFRIQIQNGAAQAIKVQMINGRKKIDVRENDRRIKISESPQQGIEFELHDQHNGQLRVRKYTAKDATELRQKHPEIHRLYVQYAKQPAGGAQRVIIGLPGRPGAGGLPRFPNQRVAGTLDQAIARLKASSNRLQKLVEDSQDEAFRDQMKRELENLETTRLQLESARKQLPPR